MTRPSPLQRREQQTTRGGGARQAVLPATDGAASPLRQALRGTTFAEGERMLAPESGVGAPVQRTPSGSAAATTARGGAPAPRGARAALDYYGVGALPAGGLPSATPAPRASTAPTPQTPHPGPAREEESSEPVREGGAETEVEPTAEGDTEEVSVGVGASHRARRTAPTTVGADASVTVGREEGEAGARAGSADVSASVAHRMGRVTVTLGAAMSMARAADGNVTVGGEGSVAISLRRWAELRVAGQIDDQGRVSGSAGLTINVLRAMGVRHPPADVSATVGGSIDADGQPTGQAGLSVTIPGS